MRTFFSVGLLPLAIIPVIYCAMGIASAEGGIISIDLTQVGTESGSNIAGDTWRWGGGDPRFFDLEFSSGNGNHLDLDGGSALGNEYFPGYGSMPVTNHTYDLLRAEYTGGNAWSLAASRDGGASFTPFGSVTEYVGVLSHADNYRYQYPGGGADQSDPVNGPEGAGVNYAVWEPWKAWLWLYRDSISDTVSLNVVLGSAGAPPPDSGNISDGGSFRAEVTFDGLYTGAATEIVGNEPGEVDGTNPFQLDNDWNAAFDDGAVLGGITPFAVPEPSTFLLGSAIGAIGLVIAVRRRRLIARPEALPAHRRPIDDRRRAGTTQPLFLPAILSLLGK